MGCVYAKSKPAVLLIDPTGDTYRYDADRTSRLAENLEHPNPMRHKSGPQYNTKRMRR
jgi:hypothetical protein